ncbi:MAG: AAA family ATPase [Nitrosopumilaceae archaeon]|nr:AAA family ATPase [Nitrosopumilaceae archaeon]
MIINEKETLWVEKYRPQQISDCVLPARIKSQFDDIIKTGDIPNMLFYGSAGVGKTTVAKAICKMLNVDWMIINVSEESGIDTLRTKIRDFASTLSLTNEDGGKKCVVLDEFDHASSSLQAGLRGFIETFSKTCSFIMTCNFPNRIIEPIHSRTVGFDFSINAEEMKMQQAHFFKRVCDILDNEGVEYDKKVLIRLVQNFAPDNRRILNHLQQYSKSGVIDEGALLGIEELTIEKLVVSMKDKKFKDVRQWCAENAKNDLTNTYTLLYNELKNYIEPKSIPEAIITIADYQKYDSVVPDKEIHICALATELMMGVEFK